MDSTGNKEIKDKNNARTKKIKDKEHIATTAPVMGYYDVANDPHKMKPKNPCQPYKCHLTRRYT